MLDPVNCKNDTHLNHISAYTWFETARKHRITVPHSFLSIGPGILRDFVIRKIQTPLLRVLSHVG